MAVVERQPAVAHVLTVDAFGSRGDTDDLRFLHICACWGGVDTRKTHQLKDEQVEMDKSVVPEGTFSSVALFLKPGCQLSMVGCRTGANLPVVMTTPARTFRRA